MIKASLLNSGASLNNFSSIGALAFIPGENLTICIQIFDSQRGTRYVPNVAATMKLTFTKKDSTDLDKTATLVSADDRSMWTVSLSQAETQTLGGQNIVVTLDELGDGTKISKALVENAIQRTNLSGDC